MKLRDGKAQYVGEVYQLLLGFAGEELFEAIIDVDSCERVVVAVAGVCLVEV